VNTLWPLFGISNQLLAAVALCVGTTIIVKMGKARYAWVTLLPLAWLTLVTMSACLAKIFSPQPRLGFLAHAHMLQASQAAGTLPAGVKTASDLARMVANDYLDAAVTVFFALSFIVVLADSAREWFAVISGAKAPRSTEVPFVQRPAVAGD
jgi:carbon starvation protein